MLRFASDLTFALGSADVTQAPARPDQLARVLNSDSAGPTTSRSSATPTACPSAARPPHATRPTRTSPHTAISVRDALATAGVSRNRLQVAGWGEYRPAVPNNPGRQGTAQNRRVEIFLVPSTADMYQAAPTPAPAARSSPRDRPSPRAPQSTRSSNPASHPTQRQTPRQRGVFRALCTRYAPAALSRHFVTASGSLG